MPRNGSGVYSQPGGTAAVSGATISSSAYNTLVSDIADEITGSLPVNGTAAMTSPLKLPDGTAAAPSLTFTNSTTRGLYKTTNGVGVAVGGARVADITSSTLTVDIPTVISMNSASTALRVTQEGAGDAFVVEDAANPDSSKFVVDATGAVTAASTISDSLGNVRTIIQNSQTSAYSVVASDNGKHISITTGGVTFNTSTAFTVGMSVVIFNNSGSSQTITATGVTLRQAGTSNTGNRTLAGYGLATVLCYATDSYVISGSGVT